MNKSEIDPSVVREDAPFFDPIQLRRVLRLVRRRCLEKGQDVMFEDFYEGFQDSLEKLTSARGMVL